MGRIRQFLNRIKFSRSKSKSVKPQLFENLEPRIMLSADSLLSGLYLSDPIDNSLLETENQVIECTQLQEVNESTELQTRLEGSIKPDFSEIQIIDFDNFENSLYENNLVASYFGTPVLNFDGQDYSGVRPPDTVGDVGLYHYIQATNDDNGTNITIYNKSDGSIAVPQFNLSTLASGATGGSEYTGHGDPIVLYDNLADQWLLMEFEPKPNKVLNIFISDTSTPTDNGTDWTQYRVETPNFPDYPKITLWPDAYFIGTNESDNPVYALDRNAMLTGNGGLIDPIRLSTTDRPNWPFNHIMPVHFDGSILPANNEPGIFIRQVDDELTNPGGADPNSDFIEIWEFNPDFATPANSTYVLVQSIAIVEFAMVDLSWEDIPQPGTLQKLDALDDVMMWRPQYRNFGTYETIVGNFTMDDAVTGVDQAGIRWFELRKSEGGEWVLHQEGTFAPDGENRWAGAIAMDGAGNIALAYNISSDTVFPGIRYTGRLSTDPLGTLPQGEYTLIDGSDSQTVSDRWGDYSAMSIDPVDDSTFWYTGEYIPSGGNWATQIAAFSFFDLTAPSPDPMTWSTTPHATSTSAISMAATLATDLSLPVYYYFDSSGGHDSGWQTSRYYTDSGLEVNHQYGYRVKARDSSSNLNQTDYSSWLFVYTYANTPIAEAFSDVTSNSIKVNWNANGNPNGTEYFCMNLTKGTNSSWITDLSWLETGLDPNQEYQFRVKARNGDNVETSYDYTDFIYTHANIPSATYFSELTQSSVHVNWGANGNPAGTEYFCENITLGINSGWITDLSWEDTGLEVNHQYEYHVKARNKVGVNTEFNDSEYIYTLANEPITADFSDTTQTSIKANWQSNGNPNWTEYLCENITLGTNSGWTTDLFWDNTGLEPGHRYDYQVRARNGDEVETIIVELGAEATWKASLDVPKTILDFNTIISEIELNDLPGIISDVNVQLDITHDYNPDLDVYLISPSSTRVKLFTDVGDRVGKAGNFINTGLDNEAAISIRYGVTPFTGIYRPEGNLPDFNGEDPNGIWQLEITDDAYADMGMLNNWAIQVRTILVPEISVKGNGVEIVDGDTTPNANDYTDFSTLDPNVSIITRTFTIYNTGSKVLNLTGSPKVIISGSSDFTVITQPDSTVLPEESTTFQIRFDPTSEDLQTATVNILNDDSDESLYSFEIQGVGHKGVWLESSDAPKQILDNKTITSTLSVNNQTGVISDLDVYIDINHTNNSDLEVYLISPNGTRIQLFADIGETSRNFHYTALDGQAAGSIVDASAPYTGIYRPEGNLSVFNGETPNGIWQLEITDDEYADLGVLNTWALRIRTQYEQDFESGLPGVSDGWEYYSSNEGRIQVVDGRLRFDDYGDNWSYSLNEAILHVNLTNINNVMLTLDHFSLADENTAFPENFTGHYNGDGIALSVDGMHWIRVTSLTTSFTGRSFALDPIIEQAKTAAGSIDVSNVSIKFQQYDNTVSPKDGREFDNIHVESLAIQNVPYNQSFATGKPDVPQGWEYYSSNEGRIQVVDGHLRLDDYGDNWSYSLNEAILHVNLTNMNNVMLTLDHVSLADENTALPENFTGHYNGDGIVLSVDGTHWVRVTSLTTSFTGQSFALDSIIEKAKTAAGSTDVSNVSIKFQQYDNTVSPKDGREFDNIKIDCLEIQHLPYAQNFSTGKPEVSQGWEYYSSNEGRIQVVDGHLRLDDYGDNYSYSLNEAILHLDLTGKTNVTLTLDHSTIYDENTALPASYTGHYNGDGIALSIDGIHWITVTSLTTSFTGQSFSLDSIIEQAQIAAVSTDTSNVRIKFQQYDNTNGNDGREFDNIQITTL